MSESIGIIKLVSESKQFVFSNLDVLKDHLKIIFPLVLLLELVSSMAKVMMPPPIDPAHPPVQWVALILVLPLTYLYACFALSWHRSSLMGANSAHAINPLSFEKKNWGFILIFFGLIIGPFIVSVLIGMIIGGAVVTHNAVLIFVAITAAIVASLYLFIQLIRLSFLLPAKSVDVSLTMAEARKASRGLVWKMLGAGMLIGLAFALAVSLYLMIVAFTVGMMTKGAEPSLGMTGFITFLFGVPVQAAAFLVTAMNVTVLSRAYQWGMQNNA